MSDTPTVRMRATFVVEYDANPEHYPDPSPEGIAKFDLEGLDEDPGIFLEMGGSTLTVEPATPPAFSIETYRRRLEQVRVTHIGPDGIKGTTEHTTEYRWRAVARNGEIVASGEGYSDKRDRDRAIELLGWTGIEQREVEV